MRADLRRAVVATHELNRRTRELRQRRERERELERARATQSLKRPA
jgi:hypothetical protein